MNKQFTEEAFFQKGVLATFAKFTGNTSVGVSFFIRLQPSSLQLYQK